MDISMNSEQLYSHILVPVENSWYDETVLNQARRLGHLCGAKLTLVHVADGFMARNQKRLSVSPEMENDRNYLQEKQKELSAEGLDVSTVLLCGEPAEQILKFAHDSDCDLIAMATHGHRGLSDIILGSVATKVRHKTYIPVLMVKAHASKKTS